MKRIGDDLLLQEAYLREEALTSAADAINDKASQVFSAAAILAVQPSIVLVMGTVSIFPLVIQVLAVLALVASIVLAHLALAIEDFEMPNPDENWRDEVVAQLGNESTDADRRDHLTWGLLLGSKERISKNEKYNAQRYKQVQAARNCLLLALLTNSFVLVFLAFTRFF